jgi:replicative DNA helicase
VAQANEGPVLLWSQEMDIYQVYDRMISRITGIPYANIRNKNMNDGQWTQVNNVYDNLEYLPIFVEDSAGVTIDQIRATARQFKRKYGKIAMIAVDYLQIMNIPQKKGETRAQAIGRVTGAAKQIAREMNCCFMMLSQMSREFEKGALRPQLSHLKESGSIEQDADMVEFLWHDPNNTHKEGKVIQQTIAKGRNTGLNEFRLLFRGWKQHFEELPRE